MATKPTKNLAETKSTRSTKKSSDVVITAKKSTKTRKNTQKSANSDFCLLSIVEGYGCYIKAFLAGIAFPALILPLIYTLIYYMKKEVINSHDFHLLPLFVPILFGLFNVVYCATHKYCIIKDHNYCLWSMGALLGLLVAFPSVFILEVPTVLYGFKGIFVYTPFLLLPVIYGAIFRYIINCLNNLLGVKLLDCK